MAKKRNQELRNLKDYYSRKKMNEGKGWVNKALETEDKPRDKKKKSKRRDSAKRLKSNFN